MSQKSLETFYENIRNNRITTNKEVVYVSLQKHCFNLDELRKYTNMKHQTLTAALSHLMDEGLVFQFNDKFYLSDAGAVETLKAERKLIRYRKWVKAGERENFFVRHAWDSRAKEIPNQPCHS
jgi:predicted transcriptional regulator